MTIHAIIDRLNADPLPWLLEEDRQNPGVRWFCLTELLGREKSDSEVQAARQAVMQYGQVPVMLAAQEKEGYWVESGAGYYPKYRGTLWQVIFLAQLGADGSDPRVRLGCEYAIQHCRAPSGAWSINARRDGIIHCLAGNLCAALIDLGWLGDERLDMALDWLARSVTGEGIALSEDKAAEVRYLRSGNCAPDFACSANNYLPCAWGAVKAMLALSKVPLEQRSRSIQAAIDQGIAFLFSSNPAAADYPMGFAEKPSRSWFQFGYPIAYVTDVLQNLEVLTALGCGSDERLKAGVELLLSKQDNQGRWKMEYTYNGKIWADVETKGQPSKWVTLRALRVLNRVFA